VGVVRFSADILLAGDTDNLIRIEATDTSGNTAFVEWTAFTDINKPRLSITNLPDYVNERFVQIKGTISEQADYEIFVDNRSSEKGSGTTIDERVSLKEGKNDLRIVLMDEAGWETTEEFVIESDSQPPRIKAEISKGYEYYEGRASSSITGETKSGAKVYLSDW